MKIVGNVLILNKPQAEQNFATKKNAIIDIDVNDVRSFKS